MFENKKLLQGLVTVGIVSLSLFFLAKTSEALRGNYTREMPPTITVSGEGEYFAVPDTATFNFTVEREGKTQKEANDIGAVAMNKILDSIKKEFSLDSKDIKTTSISVNPKYEYNTPCRADVCPMYMPVSSNPKIIGYVFNQSVTVKVRNLEKAGDIAANLAELGATNVYGPDFTVADEDVAKESARMEAIKDAKVKAMKLSKQLGVRLGKVQSFSENGGGGMYPMYASTAGYARDSVSEKAVAPELPTGENKYSSSVSITYEIR